MGVEDLVQTMINDMRGVLGSDKTCVQFSSASSAVVSKKSATQLKRCMDELRDIQRELLSRAEHQRMELVATENEATHLHRLYADLKNQVGASSSKNRSTYVLPKTCFSQCIP